MAACVCLLGLLGPVAPASADEADRQFTFAVRLMQRDEPRLADDAFRDFIRRYENDRRVSDAHYYLSLLARQRGDREAAIQHLKQVADPQYVPAASLDLTRGQVYLESGDARAAVEALERIDPEKLADEQARATRSYLLGSAYRSLGNGQAAAEEFDRAAGKETPLRGPARLELGKTRVDLDRPAEAIEALREALRAGLDAPSAAEARSLVADVAYRMGRYETAAEYYQRVIERHQAAPQFKPALIGVLRSLHAAGKNRALVERYQTLRELLPAERRGEALYLLADAHVRLGDYEKALSTLDDLRNRGGTDAELDAEADYLYGISLYQTAPARFEQWIAEGGIDLEKNPHRRELRYLRAQAAIRQERFDAAAAHLTPLIDSPDEPYARRALLQRAELRERMNQVRPAAEDYAQYVRHYAGDPKADQAAHRAIDLLFRGGAFERVGDLASKWLKKEGLVSRGRAGMRLKLAVSRIKLHEYDAALDDLDRVLGSEPSADLTAYAHYYRGLILAARDGASEASGRTNGAPAIGALRAALEGPLEESQRIESLALIARLHRVAGREAEALRAYEALRERNAMKRIEPGTALWVGRELHERGEHEAALSWLNPLIGEDRVSGESGAEALFLTAESKRSLGRYDAAIEAYRRLIALSRGYGNQGRLGLARAYAAADRYDEALNEYAGLLDAEAGPIASAALLESALLDLERAARLASAGDRSAAASRRERARKRLHRVTILYDVPQLAPAHARSLLALGRLDAEADQPEKAREYYREILGRPAMSPWNRAARAEQRLLDGRRGEAVFLLRKTMGPGETADPPALHETRTPRSYARMRLFELRATGGASGNRKSKRDEPR